MKTMFDKSPKGKEHVGGHRFRSIVYTSLTVIDIDQSRYVPIE